MADIVLTVTVEMTDFKAVENVRIFLGGMIKEETEISQESVVFAVFERSSSDDGTENGKPRYIYTLLNFRKEV